jgi:PST family polysaccharide transporter
MSIQNQVSFGIKWSAVSIFLIRATRFITSIVLARLLAPEMFGIVAMANVAIDTIGVIRQVGFGSAYIYRHFDDPDEMRRAENTVFYATTVISFLLFGVCFLLAPVIARFFKAEAVETILRVMVLTFLLDPLSTIPSFILLKRLAFGRQSKCEIGQAVTHAGIGVSLAFMGCGVWSLVFAQLGSRLVFGVLVCAYSGWRPRWEFSVRLARELFGYGKFLWACSLFAAVGGAFDRALIGRFFGAGSLGYYHVGFNLARLPSEALSSLFAKITFPALSRLNRERERLKNAVVRTISVVTFAAMPIGFGLYAVAGAFVAAVYGAKWLPSVPLIEVLAFFGMVQCISPITGNVLKAIGSPKVLLGLSFFHHATLITLLVLLVPLGSVGICYALLIAAFVSAVVSFFFVNRRLAIGRREFAEPIVRSAAAAGLMALAVRYFQAVFAERVSAAPWPLLLSSVAVGVVAYGAASLALNRSVLMAFVRTGLGVLASTGRDEEAAPTPAAGEEEAVAVTAAGTEDAP